MNTDAPASAAHWAQQRERGSLAAMRLMAWIATTFGRTLARCFLHPITLYFLLAAPAARARSMRYLSRALGRKAGLADAYRHVHCFASTVLDRVYLARRQMQRFDFDYRGLEMMDTLAAQRQGAVLLGAHLGSFEALHAVGSSRPGLRVAMVMYPQNARLIHSVLKAIAPGFELDIIAIGSSASTLLIRDWLDSGGVAGLLGDRALSSEAGRGHLVELPFLGHPARFSDGPLRLAMLLRRPVVFMVGLYRGGRRYDVRFEALADFSGPQGNASEREQRVRDTLQAYVQKLEALCHEAPYNWFNFHDFWNEDVAH